MPWTMTEDLRVGHIVIPLSELAFAYARGSGPGGQNVNKVNSKAVLTWDVTASPSLPPGAKQRFLARYGSRLTNEGALVMASDKFRDQQRNVQDCLDKLAEMIELIAVAPKTRKATKPSRGAKERRLAGKKARKDIKSGRRAPKDY
jgi:ribosome-associated protein